MSSHADTAINLEEIDDENVWIRPPFHANNLLHSSLSALEHTFRCPICCELLRVPVSIQPCQHSFCSECIRAHVKAGLASLKRQAKCPICRQEIARDLKCLVPNRTVESIVRQYKGLRNELKNALSNRYSQSSTDEHEDDHDGNLEPHAVERRKRRRPSTRSEPITTQDLNPPSISPPPRELTVLRKPRPNTHYMGLTKAKLAALCRQEGLSDTGDPMALKARHQAFISLYNAECDSFTPKSAEEIAKEINEREHAKKLEERHNMMNGGLGQSSNIEQLKKSREAAGTNDATNISSGNPAFDSKMNSKFAEMTRLLKEQKKKRSLKEIDSTSPACLAAELTPPLETLGSTAVLNEYTSSTNFPTDSSPPTPNTKVGQKATYNDPRLYKEQERAKKRTRTDCIREQTNINIIPQTRPSPQQKSRPNPESTRAGPGGESTVRRVHATAEAPRLERPSDNDIVVIDGTIGPWTCLVCTFHNVKYKWSRAKCEACGCARGTEAPGETISIDC